MKLRGQFGWLATVAIMAIGLLPAVLALAEDQPTPTMVINEIAWAGSSRANSGSDDEWIELKNISPREIDLTGWRIVINNPGTDYTRIVPSGLSVVPAGGFFVIANFSPEDDRSVLATTVHWSMMGMDELMFGITNSKFAIGLMNAAEEQVDVAGDFNDPKAPFAGRSNPRASMERKSSYGPGDSSTSWQTAITSENFDDGITDLGTPGAENSVIVEPPTLASITPARAETEASLEIESIVGTNFWMDSPPTVQLKLNGSTITADNVSVASSELIDGGRFSLDGAETGRWDLIVTNPDGQMALLPQAVEITEPPPQYDLTTTVRLNEVYPQPNTTSNDEYIELYNFGEKTVNLDHWVIDDIRDGGSSPFTISARNILPKTYLALYKSETKITLNDSGDSVFLIQPDGFELDRTTYDTAPRGQTWARFDDGWEWTSSPTPNGKNVFSEPPPPIVPPSIIDEPDDTLIIPTFKTGDVLITELLPNPDDKDEFIELYNASNQPIDLKNWGLADKSKRKYKIDNFAVSIQTADALIIQPQQYVVITNAMSSIALNNTGGETVTLTDPAGDVIASASYPDKAPVDATYALVDGLWTWSKNPTPAAINILALDEADEAPPKVDIVLPDTLPVTGEGTRRWWGLGLVGLVLSAVVCWGKIVTSYR